MPERSRLRQGLRNWWLLVWPTCPDRGTVGETPVWCDRPRWHRGDHAFGSGFGAIAWPKGRRR